jgi:hypothetical protein
MTTTAAAKEYALGYRDGLSAGQEYPWPEEWRTLYKLGAREYLTRSGTHEAACMMAGWMRGFRHGCMKTLTSR